MGPICCVLSVAHVGDKVDLNLCLTPCAFGVLLLIWRLSECWVRRKNFTVHWKLTVLKLEEKIYIYYFCEVLHYRWGF